MPPAALLLVAAGTLDRSSVEGNDSAEDCQPPALKAQLSRSGTSVSETVKLVVPLPPGPLAVQSPAVRPSEVDAAQFERATSALGSAVAVGTLVDEEGGGARLRATTGARGAAGGVAPALEFRPAQLPSVVPVSADSVGDEAFGERDGAGGPPAAGATGPGACLSSDAAALVSVQSVMEGDSDGDSERPDSSSGADVGPEGPSVVGPEVVAVPDSVTDRVGVPEDSGALLPCHASAAPCDAALAACFAACCAALCGCSGEGLREERVKEVSPVEEDGSEDGPGPGTPASRKWLHC